MIPSDKFSRGAAFLIAGAAAAQIIRLAATPIITRLYSPEAFGTLAVFVTIYGLLSVISSFRYANAIPIAQTGEEALGLVALSAFIVGVFALTSTLLNHFLSDEILGALSIETLSEVIYILPAAILLNGLYQIFTYWNLRAKRFSVISKTEISKSISQVLIQLGAFTLGSTGLVLGQMLSSIVGVGTLGKIYFSDLKHYTHTSKVDLKKLWSLAKKYIHFPLYSMPNAVFNTAGRELPSIVLAVGFGPAIAGMYFLAYQMTMQSIQLVTSANAKVYTAYAPEAYRNGALGQLYSALYNQSVKIFTLPLSIACLVAPGIFPFIFGSEWSQAGIVSAILMPWILIVAIVNPVSATALVVDKQREALGFELLLAALRLGGLAIGVYFHSFYLAVALFSSGAVIGTSLNLVWLAYIAGAKMSGLIKCLTTELAIATAIYVVGLLVLEYTNYYVFITCIFVCGFFILIRSFNAFRAGVY